MTLVECRDCGRLHSKGRRCPTCTNHSTHADPDDPEQYVQCDCGHLHTGGYPCPRCTKPHPEEHRNY